MKKNNIFIEIGSVVTYIYGVLNMLSVVCMLVFPWDKIVWLTECILTVDVFTWHIFGILSILTFIGKANNFIKEKQNGILRKYTTTTTSLHFVFMIISFICIGYMFNVCF